MAAQNVQIHYSRVLSRAVAAAAGELRLLSQGAVGTEFQGSLSFAANTLGKGDVIRIFAWGNWTNSDSLATGDGRFKLYFNNGGAIGGANPVLSDTGTGAVQNLPPLNSNPVYWKYEAYITIRSTGAGGTVWVDTFLYGIDMQATWIVLPGGGQFSIPMNQANDLELTQTVNNVGTVTLTQCTIERMPSP